MTEFPTTLAGPRAVRLRPLRSMAICLAIAAVAVTLPLVEHAGLYAVVLGLFLCFLGPLWLSWARGRLDYFESINVFGLIYFVYFGLGSVWTVNDPHYVAYDLYIVPYVPKAALYCLLGYLALFAGYRGPWRGSIDVRPAPERLRGPLFVLLTGGLGLVGYLAVGVAERSMSIASGVTAVVGSLSQLAPIFLFAWALTWMSIFSDSTPRKHKGLLLATMIPAAGLTALATFSDKSLVMTLIGVPIVARWYTRRRVPWTFLLVLLLVLMFVVFPFYNTYRWSDASMGQVDRMRATYATVQSWDADTYLQYSVRSFTRRLAMINSVAVVVRDVDRWVPYAAGRTIFVPAIVYFVPRVLWPDKPLTTLGRDFGEIFRVTNYLTRDTYIAVTLPGELYWNFDLPGIILGMALFGVALRFLYRLYAEGEGEDAVRRSIHIMLIIAVAHMGGSLAMSIVTIIRTLVLLEAMRWLGRRMGLIEDVPAGSR